MSFRRTLGIRGRLFLAFGLVAALTVLASGVAFLSYDRVRDSLADITGKNLPAMGSALALARESAAIAAASPVLASASDQKAREAAASALDARMRKLDELIGTLAAWPENAEATARLRATAQKLAANVALLSQSVERRIALKSQRETLATNVRTAHRALGEKIAPLVDDAAFNLTLALQSAGEKPDAAELGKTLGKLADTDLAELQAVSALQAEGNLVQGLLTEATITPRKEYLEPLRESYRAAAGRIAKALAQLKESPNGPALKTLLTALLAYGEGEQSAFTLRVRELDEIAASEKILAANRELAQGLEREVAALVDATDGEATAAAAGSEAAISRGRLLLAAIAAASLALALGLAWFYAGRNVARRLIVLRGSMAAVAGGDFAAEIPTGGSDEIAEMAGALRVFRDAGLAAREAAARAEEDRRRLAEERRHELLALAESFESSVKGVVGNVSGAADEMRSTAARMVATAGETTRQAGAVAQASAQASENVQTVAAATEELASSTSEIGRQVEESSKVAGQAVGEAQRTAATVKELAEAAQRIGEVVALISDIASQTNLLALNATIEAARAGEAGKGFAVVASEVKTLATQTAKATDDIGTQIRAIQDSTRGAVDAIAAINAVIARIDEIATAVAVAVEEQNATTRDIAKNVQQAAKGTREVSGNIAGVTEAAGAAGNAASLVAEAAAGLAQQSQTLSEEVERFLARVRAA